MRNAYHWKDSLLQFPGRGGLPWHPHRAAWGSTRGRGQRAPGKMGTRACIVGRHRQGRVGSLRIEEFQQVLGHRGCPLRVCPRSCMIRPGG